MSEAENTIVTAAATTVAVPVVLTKEEKIAKIRVQIKNLEQKIEDITNGVVRVAVKKVAYAPAVNDKVLATTGRTTATTQAKVVEGVVVGIRVPAVGADGKLVGATQYRVQIGDGFDTQFVTVYAGNLQPAPVVAEDDEAEVVGADSATEGDYPQ